MDGVFHIPAGKMGGDLCIIQTGIRLNAGKQSCWHSWRAEVCVISGVRVPEGWHWPPAQLQYPDVCLPKAMVCMGGGCKNMRTGRSETALKTNKQTNNIAKKKFHKKWASVKNSNHFKSNQLTDCLRRSKTQQEDGCGGPPGGADTVGCTGEPVGSVTRGVGMR